MKGRFGAWLGALGLLGLGCAGYASATPEFDSPHLARILCFGVIGVCGVGAVFLQPAISGRWKTVSVIWIPALLARLLLLPAAPSDDVNRYLWEGKLVAAGESPYARTADAPEWTEYRDRYWEAMNHKDKPTAYPPLALGAFALIGELWYRPMAFKLAFVLADLLTLGAVLALLRRRGLSSAFAAFYSLNPLVLIAYAGEAHFDSLMIAPLVWALAAGGAGMRGALVALSAGVKWMTLPLLPFVLFERGGRDRGLRKRFRSVAALVAAAVLGGPAFWFFDTLPQLIQGLAEFGTTRSFNGPVYGLLHLGSGLSRSMASVAVAVLFLALLGWRWRWRDEAPLDETVRWVLGGLVLLAPTVHFWYIAWLIPFVALRPSLPWVVLSLSSACYFAVWWNQAEAGVWGLRPWQQWLIWCPFLLACVYEVWSTRGAVLRKSVPAPGDRASLTVVVPTLNAEDDLPRALASVASQRSPADEVIVVDGGSTDGTVAIAKEASSTVRLLTADLGRGGQILRGMEAAAGDWVVVLHADAELPENAFSALRRAVAAQPNIVGGAFGQRFSDEGHGLLWIEWLNDMRALFTRTAFGDQVQFFQREHALRNQVMPNQPLMEDVESSWRLRECGPVLFLNQPCRVSHGKWMRDGWRKRARLVMRLMIRYRWERRKGRAAAGAFSRRLYADYYGVSRK